MSKSKKIVILFSMILVAMGVFFYFSNNDFEKSDLPAVSYNDLVDEKKSDEVVVIVQEGDAEAERIDKTDTEVVIQEKKEDENIVLTQEETIPVEFNLAVPFTPQAPYANWDLPYQEACEEASVYMVAQYFLGVPEGLINARVADKGILDLVQFEKSFSGNYLDSTVAEVVEWTKEFYDLESKVVDDPTVKMIKKEISNGNPVVVPAAGRLLGNPNFSGEGPLYHMLIIKGYTEDTFITNDPGTRNGENYIYKIPTIMQAIGDWNDGKPETGAKRVIFFNGSK